MPERKPEYWLECVGPGWRPIVKECLDAIIPLGAHITQVKEKFGGLRVYYALTLNHNETIVAEIRRAEYLAGVTCEDCGEPGVKVEIRGWLKTLCEKHLTERQK